MREVRGHQGSLWAAGATRIGAMAEYQAPGLSKGESLGRCREQLRSCLRLSAGRILPDLHAEGISVHLEGCCQLQRLR